LNRGRQRFVLLWRRAAGARHGADMATIEELENRVRCVESETEGEKAVTRQVYLQAIRNGDQIGALRSEVATARVDIQALTSQTDHIVGEVVQSTALLRSHGLRLEALTRDVGLLRSDVTALRRGQEELHVRLDGVEARLDRVEARLDRLEARLDRVEARLDAIEARLDRLEARLDRLETEIGEMRRELGEVNRKLDILIAAITPRNLE
jgi:chromosome segregation ATPase